MIPSLIRKMKISVTPIGRAKRREDELTGPPPLNAQQKLLAEARNLLKNRA